MKNIYAYYINVFRDTDGNVVGSEDGIMNNEATALNEAIKYSLDFGWDYIETLSNHSYPIDFTTCIRNERNARAEEKAEDKIYGSYDDQVRKHHDSLIRG